VRVEYAELEVKEQNGAQRRGYRLQATVTQVCEIFVEE
jgi:hypothetical protein